MIQFVYLNKYYGNIAVAIMVLKNQYQLMHYMDCTNFSLFIMFITVFEVARFNFTFTKNIILYINIFINIFKNKYIILISSILYFEAI